MASKIEPAARDAEIAWIRRIAQGEREAFEELYRAYQNRIFRYLCRMVRNPETAAELLNDVMLEVWKRAGTFRAESRASTWIFGIAHHKALNALRGKSPVTVDAENAIEVEDPAEGPEQLVERESLERVIQHALERLSPEHREILELTFYEELSYPEIAAIVGCPINTVKTRVFYAKRQLQPLLERFAIGRKGP